jgi:hypothetical protein
MVHIGFLHHVEELARIGRQRFDIAPLPFGIDGVEGQRRLARPRQPGDHHQLVAGNIDIDSLEVMFARAAHLDELLFRHGTPPGQQTSHSGERAKGQSENVNDT